MQAAPTGFFLLNLLLPSALPWGWYNLPRWGIAN